MILYLSCNFFRTSTVCSHTAPTLPVNFIDTPCRRPVRKKKDLHQPLEKTRHPISTKDNFEIHSLIRTHHGCIHRQYDCLGVVGFWSILHQKKYIAQRSGMYP